MSHWSSDAFFYHIYPLGLCGAPAENDLASPPQPRLEQVYAWLDHLQSLGINALYLGPLFESGSHGYDTCDYFQVDRRLGTNDTLARLSKELHRRGMRLILDGVFNHVGRQFWAFRDVQGNRQASAYREWFANLNFNATSPYGDPFSYEGWNGHYNLVKLNHHHPEVRRHLFEAVKMWIEQFGIDGLRLDAADCIDLGFLQELAAFCRSLRPDFWLLGEIIHGDYRRWANPQTLDSVTNYEAYKGLYSSHEEHNYFEIAYSLNRQFGEEGMYRGLPLYAFADNHDVSRVASLLSEPAHLYPLYCLLLTMPGVPSLYYGSEWGLPGRKHNGDDSPLRPALDIHHMSTNGYNHDLVRAISRLAAIRRQSPALRLGDYRTLVTRPEQLVFARQAEGECVIVAVNASDKPIALEVDLPVNGVSLEDWLNPGDPIQICNRRARIDPLWPHWGRILRVRA